MAEFLTFWAVASFCQFLLLVYFLAWPWDWYDLTLWPLHLLSETQEGLHQLVKERLGELLRVLKVVISKHQTLNSVDILGAAGTVIAKVKGQSEDYFLLVVVQLCFAPAVGRCFGDCSASETDGPSTRVGTSSCCSKGSVWDVIIIWFNKGIHSSLLNEYKLEESQLASSSARNVIRCGGYSSLGLGTRISRVWA